jgi:hypothetical protein
LIFEGKPDVMSGARIASAVKRLVLWQSFIAGEGFLLEVG